MAIQFLSPSVFIEEVSSTVQTTQSVSASTAAFAGFTTQGPVGEARLVTSFDEYSRVYGDFSSNSYMTHQAAAYFSNGGRRAYILRIIPSDATSSTASIQSKVAGQVISNGDGSADTYTDALPVDVGSIALNGSSSGHIVPGSFTAKYRAARDAVVEYPVRMRDDATIGTTQIDDTFFEGRIDTKALYISSAGPGTVLYRSKLDGNTDITITQVDTGTIGVVVTDNDIVVNLDAGVSLASEIVTAIGTSLAASALITAELYNEDVMAAAAIESLNGIPAFDSELNAVVPLVTGGDDFQVSWQSGGTKTIDLAAADLASVQSPIVTADNGTSSVSLDLKTGIFVISFGSGEEPDGAGDKVLISYVPASATVSLASGSVVDTNSLIDITGDSDFVVNGGAIADDSFLNIATGEWSVAFESGTDHIPALKSQIVATYKVAIRSLTPISNGEWGSNVRVQINGSIEYFVAATASYSRQNVFILLQDRDGNYQLKETFEDLDFTDSSDPLYMPEVLNELSELVNVSAAGIDESPRQLDGLVRNQVLGGGTETTANRVISATLGNPAVARRTVVITYMNTSSVLKTITDDGSGNLVGSVDSSYSGNTINYTTGVIDFKTIIAIKGGTFVTIVYYTRPEETLHTEDFGDTTKAYTYTTTSPVAATFSYYVEGTDGTFSDSTYGRDQFTLPALRETFDGIYALDRVEEILQVCVPDFAGDVAISLDLLDYADLRAAEPQGGDRFIILTTPAGYTAQQAADWFRFNLVQSSNYAAIYWPWVKVKDPLANNRPLTVPSLGHVAGVYARTDANKNVGKAPGGTIDGQLNYLIGLESTPTLTDRNLVYSNKINPFISTDLNGTAVWGIQTIAQDPRWRLINARRLFMFVEQSVFGLTQWAIFENNGPSLWAKLKSQLTSFLTDLFNQGYFAGNNPSEGFKVVIDSTNNNQATIDAGQLYIDLAIRPFKSVEFLVVRLSVLTAA